MQEQGNTGRSSIGTADQRRDSREALDARVTMRIETTTATGQSDNASRAGILFYTDDPIQVSIEVQGPSGPRVHHGRLIRLQRMSESSTGLAVEFDPE